MFFVKVNRWLDYDDSLRPTSAVLFMLCMLELPHNFGIYLYAMKLVPWVQVMLEKGIAYARGQFQLMSLLLFCSSEASDLTD